MTKNEKLELEEVIEEVVERILQDKRRKND